MTNTTTTSAQINSFVTEANRFVINALPNSTAKAFYIDLPIVSILTLNPISVLKTFSVASATYEIRGQINNFFKEYKINDYLDSLTDGYGKLASGATAGLIGGAFRYYATGQNPIVGALNNAAYETCNNIDLCANNKNVNIAFAIAVEALDATAQILLTAGDEIGAIHNAFKGGALVGALIGATVYELYIPALELKVTDNTFYNYAADAVDHSLNTAGNYLFTPDDFHREF